MIQHTLQVVMLIATLYAFAHSVIGIPAAALLCATDPDEAERLLTHHLRRTYCAVWVLLVCLLVYVFFGG